MGPGQTFRMQISAALVSGLLAGLALAIPLGAIGALLFTEGLRRGFRRGLPAAAGVATADGIYSVLAIVFGLAVAPLIAAISPWPAVLGGAALIAIAGVGVIKGVRAPVSLADHTPLAASNRSVRRFLAFLALTLVNPMTLLYFVAVSTGISDVIHTVPTRLAFIGGVWIGSLGWQCVLVAAGAVLSTRIRPRAYRVTLLAGNILIAAFGVGVLINGVVGSA